MLKKIFIGLLLIFIAIQFVRPAKNVSDNNTYHLSKKYTIPDEVNTLLKNACYDCHSNKTVYPWYAEIQPLGWWLANHVKEGKRKLNFSEFTSRKLAVQNHKLEEIIEMVKEGEMPLKSYTWIHKEAVLSPDQQVILTSWAQGIMDTLRHHYPADSLVLRRQ